MKPAARQQKLKRNENWVSGIAEISPPVAKRSASITVIETRQPHVQLRGTTEPAVCLFRDRSGNEKNETSSEQFAPVVSQMSPDGY